MVTSRIKLKIVGVIPVRLESTRLPRKALRTLSGRALVHHVYSRAAQCTLLTDLILATDSLEIEAYCRKHNLKVMMTSNEHQSGTDRIYEVATRTQADIFVNVQGDEPMVSPKHIELLVEPFLASDAVQVTTLKTPISPEEAQDLSVNKVVTDTQGRALYFSHLPIPFCRDGATAPQYYKHLGFYAYRKDVIEKFSTLPVSPLEEVEKLEQLRLLENGISIQVVETKINTIGVDTEEDFRKVEEYYLRV